MIISILVTDHYSRKIDYIRDHEFEERLQKEMKERGYVLATDLAVENVENAYEVDSTYQADYTANTNATGTVVDFNDTTNPPTSAEDTGSNTPWPTGLDLSEGGNDNEVK